MMNNFDDVLGNLLARTEDNDAKRLLSAYDHSKTKPANASHLSSAAFTKTMLEATIDVLKKHTTEFYPHATALIRSKMVARTKIQIAEDICDVLYSITPTQCRSCKDIYISTSAENTDANITCLLCGRRSHKDCYNSYTIDNNVGVIFLCDACLTNTETALVLNAENAPQHHAAEQKTDTAPKTEDGNVDEDKGEVEENYDDPDEDRSRKPRSDEICPLYKTNSCPHGLTGKRHIDGEPCKGKHPLKCFYHTGKYGTNGCRYTAARCPFFHPELCENSTKLKMCLNKQCSKYHLHGTNRSMPRNTPPKPTRRENPQSLRPVQSNSPPTTQPQMWIPQQTSQPPQTTSHTQPPQNHDNGGRDSFLTYLEQMKAEMHRRQDEMLRMHQKMKSDLENSVAEILKGSMQAKAQAEQSVQAIPTVNPQPINPMQIQPNLQTYQHMYPMLIPSRG